MNKLQQKYKKEIAPTLFKELGLKSVMEIPKIEKIVINAGIGDAAHDAKNLDLALAELQAITNQKPVITKAKKSIATFKVREGQGIGAKVTLRGHNMWNFIELLFNIALPRVRDFKGLPRNSFDSQGNYNIGVKEQIIFPQIVYDNVKRVRGFNISIITSTNNREHALNLLVKLGAPIRKANK